MMTKLVSKLKRKQRVNKMAMKKSTPTPPARPGGSGSKTNSTRLGSRKGTKVRVITGTKRALTKSVVRNPDAPKGVGSGAASGSVRVITKSESMLKREKAMRERTGYGRSMNASAYSKTTTVPRGPKTLAGYKIDDSAKYKADRPGSAKQSVAGTNVGYGATLANVKRRDEKMRSATGKGNKPTKITPKKKAEAPKKAAPKRRLFVGRGGGGRGGMLAGGLNDLNK